MRGAQVEGQARATNVYHVVQVVGDLVDLAVGVAIVGCHTTRLIVVARLHGHQI